MSSASAEFSHHAPSPRGDGPVLPHRVRRRHPQPGIHLNIIPLVDVTFLLMIFFVIAGTFERWEGVLSSRMLPSGPAAGIPLPFTPVTLRLRATGAAPADFAVAIEGTARETKVFGELTNMLRDLQRGPGFSADTPVVIVSDAAVRWDHVVNAWNSAVRAGYRNVAFGSN
jgi:biopolymer transport protein ExbD